MSTISEPACYVIIRKGNTILFVLRERTGFMDGNYSLPAGRVEAGETYLQGAVREAQEEVGLTLDSKQLRQVFTAHRWTEGQTVQARTDVYFEVKSWEGTPSNNEPERHSAIAWLPVDDLPDNIMDYQRQALLDIAVGESYGEFGWPLIEKTE